MSLFSRSRAWSVLLLAAFLLPLMACESIDDDGDFAVEIRTAAAQGIPFNTLVELHAGIDEPRETWTARVDPNGVLRFRFEEDNLPHPRDFIWLEAQVQRADGVLIDLKVLVDEWQHIEAAVDEDGQITPNEFPRLFFSALRLVESEMLEHEADGLIRDGEKLRQYLDELDAQVLLDSTTALMVALNTSDPGFPDELDEIRKLFTQPEITRDLILQAGDTQPDLLAEIRTRVLDQADRKAGWNEPSELLGRFAMHLPRFPGITGDVFRFDTESSGRIGAPEGQDDFSWWLEDGSVKIDFAGDLTWRGSELQQDEDGNPVTAEFTERYDSARFHRILAGEESNLILVQAEFERVFDDEEFGTQTRTATRAMTGWFGSKDELPVEEVEGRWVLNLPDSDLDEQVASLRLDPNNMGEVEFGGWKAGETINWSSDESQLIFEAPDGRLEIEFVRPSRNGWVGIITELDETGAVISESVDLIDRGDSAFDPNDVAGTYWPFGGNVAPGMDSATAFRIRLTTAQEGEEGQAQSMRSVGWVVEDGDVVIRSCFDEEEQVWVGLQEDPDEELVCTEFRRRTWDLVRISERDEDDDDYVIVETLEVWNNEDLSEPPNNTFFKRLYFVERRSPEVGGEEQQAGHVASPLADILVPGRGHPDPEIGGER
ncbi:hypothetical protein VCB98_06395 [Gammaproteobacteria bacterium AB-CW1]|uniref:Uncharacterized protein n=1 Tax=Natronospira elongata TaxID=3110268 RepID=A0AAP6JEF8_9GAMM|nr:hypothetical protein [Gammaproteobacteria bacterium AB-CW1]